jgi:hypothetical protein
VFGPGITRSQLRQILRECADCEKFVFADRRDSHKCDGQVLLTRADDFDLVSALISFDETSGLSLVDIHHLLTQCAACKRICLIGTVNLHDCPVLGWV